MNELFLACIHEKNSHLAIRCLRIYLTLDKITNAEELVRHELVRPLIYNIVNEENLQTDPLGLQSIYHKLLNILNVELKQLLDITLHPERYLYYVYMVEYIINFCLYEYIEFINKLLQNICERI